MKKIVLICGSVIIGFTAFSQDRLAHPRNAGKQVPAEKKQMIADENGTPEKSVPNQSYALRTATMTTGDLGTAANALTAIGNRNFVWADPTIGNGTTLGTVMFTHRAVGTTTGVVNGGRLFYDISMDNGANWDTTLGPVYTPSLSTVYNPSNARYPQGAIYNPNVASNLTTDAYMTYYAAALNNTNPAAGVTAPGWGGNVYGSYKLDGSMAPTQHELSSDAPTNVWYVIPELMHMCKNGNTFALSESDYGQSDAVTGRGVALDYNGIMVWEKGVWNSTNNDWDYTQQLMSVPSGLLPYNVWYSTPSQSTNTLPVSTMLGSSIVFNDNGTNGYMVCKQFVNTTDSPDSSALLYIYKTTNGGQNWVMTHTPGYDNIDCLGVDSGFGMGISGQVFDVAMDVNDNLHMVIVVGTKYMSSTYGTSIYYQEGYGSIFDIFTTDGGNSWIAHKLKTNPIHEIYGVMGDPATSTARQAYDTRTQITRSYDGTKLFFSWFETDTVNWAPDAANLGYDNQHPDMHVIGYDVTTNMWTNEINATAFPALNGDYDGACLLGSVSYYALDNGSGGYKIPTVIGIPTATSTNNNPDYIAPFHFKYINGVDVPSGSYTVAPTLCGSAGANEVLLDSITATHNVANVNTDFVVTGVRPNPFHGTSEFMVQISKPGTVTVDVRNVLGQVVSSEVYSHQSTGLHKFTIDGNKLQAGIYLYTVTYNGQQITQKMSIQ
jgi:hypothetical protein